MFLLKSLLQKYLTIEAKPRKVFDKNNPEIINSESILLKLIAHAMKSIRKLLSMLKSLRKNHEQALFPHLTTNLLKINCLLSRCIVIFETIANKICKGRNPSMNGETIIPNNLPIIQKDICIPATYLVINCIDRTFYFLLSSLVNIKRLNESEFRAFEVDVSKLEILIENITNAINSDSEDLIYQERNSKEWEVINPFFKVEDFKGSDFIQRYELFEKEFILMTGSIIEGLKNKNTLTQFFATGWKYTKLFFGGNKAGSEAEYAMISAEYKTATKMYNLLECKLANPLLKILWPSIKVSKTIIIPKLLIPLTVDTLHSASDSHKILNEDYLEEAKNVEEISNKLISPIESFDPIKHVKIMLLSNKELPQRTQEGIFEPTPTEENFRKIIIHFHGGGFICMSANSHQNYTRKFAIQTNSVVFSVDYRLAPDYPYPNQIEDCWQAYYWIIMHSGQELGIHPETVILTGDSAGATLALAITLRAIHTQFRVPDGLFLAYPFLNTSLEAFTPSLLYSLDDIFLRYSFLIMCFRLYMADVEADLTNPYISPLNISPKDLKRFPSVRLLIAGKDPFRDDSYRFLYKLIKQGINARMIDYELFPHGFMSLDYPHMMQECTQSVQQACDFLRGLFILNEHKAIN